MLSVSGTAGRPLVVLAVSGVVSVQPAVLQRVPRPSVGILPRSIGHVDERARKEVVAAGCVDQRPGGIVLRTTKRSVPDLVAGFGQVVDTQASSPPAPNELVSPAKRYPLPSGCWRSTYAESFASGPPEVLFQTTEKSTAAALDAVTNAQASSTTLKQRFFFI